MSAFKLPWLFPLALIVLLSVQSSQGLWPIPRSLQTGSTALKLACDFDIQVNIDNPPPDLSDAVSQAKTYLWTDGLQRLVVGRGASDNATIQNARSISSLRLSLTDGTSVKSIAEEAVVEINNRSESYSLNIPDDGSSASITANSTLGLFRGLTTFTQLWYTFNGQIYTLEAPVDIDDSPAYPYRGLMLDTARNFFPVEDIKRTIDAMSWVKINTLHWHVTDSQSWPLEIPDFPELSAQGAYSPDDVYSPTDVQGLVAYAGARGIDVLLEIDTPGHTAVISASHPEFIACDHATPWGDYAGEPPAGQLRFTSAEVTNFTAAVLSSVAKTLPSSLFSTGGDEVNIPCYDADPETQKTLNATGKTLEQALDTFTQATHGSLIKEGKTPVVWEEMVLEHNITLSNNTVVMVWISSANAASVAEKNFRIVHSCDPFKTWSHSYTFDPLANITSSQRHLILGGQHLLWTEQSGPENLDSIVWPRAASGAEVFWTGATLPDGKPLNVSTALPRLHDLRFRMVQRGVKAIALQPLWCALRPGLCDLTA
ncbi:glycoside hydrolase family 20 protein [Plicaturopsis crispa FD-325 SS-3]|nr:glycoside hydrolase family 20 protein [Plicaturopsis crispa FD-325 SS-3]